MKPVSMAKRIELWPIEKLTPYDRNPRTHSQEQIQQLVESIAEFGFTAPILVDSNAGVIAGHGRLAAAKKMGLPEVPVIVLDHLTDAQRRAYIIADNKLAENAGWDQELLAEELAALAEDGFHMPTIGFTDDELAALLEVEPPDAEPRGNEDESPDVEPQAVTRPGEIWELGPHRVMCGDATDRKVIEQLCRATAPSLLWTDPPYNVAYQSSAGETIENDDMDSETFREFLATCFRNSASVMSAGGCFYIAHSDLERHNVQLAVLSAGLEPRQCLIWVKNAPTFSRQDYNWRHEAILYGWKAGAPHYFNEDFAQTTVIDDSKDFEKWPLEKVAAVMKAILHDWNTSVIYAPKPSRNELHPTMKPVALIRRMIRNSTRTGDFVLDPFAGSGSTLIACEAQGRRGLMLELVPHYVDVIVKRWQDYTSREAVLAEDGRTFAAVLAERLEP